MIRNMDDKTIAEQIVCDHGDTGDILMSSPFGTIRIGGIKDIPYISYIFVDEDKRRNHYGAVLLLLAVTELLKDRPDITVMTVRPRDFDNVPMEQLLIIYSKFKILLMEEFKIRLIIEN